MKRYTGRSLKVSQAWSLPLCGSEMEQPCSVGVSSLLWEPHMFSCLESPGSPYPKFLWSAV